MVFFSATEENHHDLALAEAGREAPSAPANAVGLYHVALKIGETLDELSVDADPAIWRRDPAAVAHAEPLNL